MIYLYANHEAIFSTKFEQAVTFHFRAGRGSQKNGYYFPFSSDVELYLWSLKLKGPSHCAFCDFCADFNTSTL